jgi:subtilisin family serine protease
VGARWAKLLILGAFVALPPAHPPSDLTGRSPQSPGTSSFVLRFEPTATGRAATLRAAGAWRTGSIESLDLVEIRLDPERVHILGNDPRVMWVEPEHQAHIAVKPNDPLLSRQWPLRRLGAFRGWDYETGKGRGVTVGVIDTGVDPSHPDLKRNVVAGWDFVASDDDPADDNGHGTHVAGIIGARPNNGRGIAGLSWGAGIMPLKSCVNEGGCGAFEVAEAIVYAVVHDARVVNLSLGGTGDGCPATYELVARFAEAGNTMLVAAAGNSAQAGNPISYPAACPGFVGVGATTPTDGWASFSQYNEFVDLSAPGQGIYSTVPPALGGVADDPQQPGYGPADGTSMAAPHVSGLAALLFAQQPDRTPKQVQQRMESTALDLGRRGRDPKFGEGRISLARALSGGGGTSP